MSLGRALRLAALALVLAPATLLAQEPKRPDLPREADPNDWEAYYDLGILRLTKGLSGADEAFAWATRIEPRRAEPLYARWIAFWKRDMRRFERSLKRDERVLRSPEVLAADSLRMMALRRNPFVHQGLIVLLYDALPGNWGNDRYTRGWLAYGQARLPQALEIFGQLVRDNPEKYGRLRFERASAFANLARNDSAAAEIDSLLAQLRRSEERVLGDGYESKELLEYARGLIHLERREVEGAQAAFGRALAENPGFGPAHAKLGALALARGDSAAALYEFALAVEVAPNDAVMRLEYARALLGLKRPRDAAAEARAAVALAPYFADTHLVLGSALYEGGDAAAARAPLMAYLERARRDDGRRDAVEKVVGGMTGGGL